MSTLLSTSLSALAALGAPAAPEVEIGCFLELESMAVGSEGQLVLDVLLEGVSAGKSGAPAPFIQLDVPDSIRLTGRHLKTHRELANNEFLQEPYEQLLEESPGFIPFEVVAAPKAGETIGINVLAYIRPGGDGSSDYFLRKRFEVPVELDGEGEEVAATNSNWGTDETLLQIGKKAPAFQLPTHDGGELDLGVHLGKKNVIVTTHRAHW